MAPTFIESADGTRLHIVTWEPAGAPKAEILLVHGLADHMGRYGHVGGFLAGRGFKVTGVELRGHGDSEGRRGHVWRWKDYSADLEAAARLTSGRLFLIGHSMGGLVVAEAVRDWKGPKVEGMVLSDPLMGVAVKAPAWKTALASTLSVILPWLPLGNEIDAKMLSRDPKVGEAYVKDPKVFHSVTPRWYTELLKAQARVLAHAGQFGIPLLGLVATDDALCQPAATLAFLDAYGDKASREIYEGHYHELFNETDHEAILDRVATWIESIL